MTVRWPPMLIAGGQLGPITARALEDLTDTAEGDRLPDLVVWDERDVDERWTDRPSTFVVRSRRLRTAPAARGRVALGNRLGDVELRLHLWRRRRADIALVGTIALDAAPWLVAHQGKRIWIPTTEDLGGLAAGLVPPPPDAGGPHELLTTLLEVARAPAIAGDPRQRWEPGFSAVPVAGTGQVVLGWGPPDRTHGIDLVGRAVAARADDLRRLGVRVRWIAPTGAAIPPEEDDDLRRAGVHDLIEVVTSADPARTLRNLLSTAAALVRCGRPGATVPTDDDLVLAYRAGVRGLGFGPGPAADLQLGARWDLLGFGDVTAVADALVGAAATPEGLRPPGPVGLEALFATAGALGPITGPSSGEGHRG